MNHIAFTRVAVSVAAALSLFAVNNAQAHIGVSNLTTGISAGGQSQFAIANTTNEILFAIPHGCTAAESSPTFSGANLDTYKISITIPAPLVSATGAASVRPVLDGTFGPVVRTTNADGSLTFTWTRLASISTPSADDQMYKVSLRVKFPTALDTTGAVSSTADNKIRKYQFAAKQVCKDAANANGGADYVMDWGTANSPTILVFPDKRRGFNAYTLDSSTVSDFTAASASATLASKLKSYFGDAAIVWVNKAGFSPNSATQVRITTLIGKDSSYSNLGATQGKSLTANDTIWVKY